ncbi:hypothetical protein [Hoeflea sp.]|jgi:hypothetical protein|uniref:hypothetical protein n=1 Tax=Hoeflea sp. TaxID=1940281 RepID=UPI003A933211
MTAALRLKLSIGLAVAAGVGLFIAANWQFVELAFSSNPGCVSVEPSRVAAKPGC